MGLAKGGLLAYSGLEGSLGITTPLAFGVPRGMDPLTVGTPVWSFFSMNTPQCWDCHQGIPVADYGGAAFAVPGMYGDPVGPPQLDPAEMPCWGPAHEHGPLVPAPAWYPGLDGPKRRRDCPKIGLVQKPYMSFFSWKPNAICAQESVCFPLIFDSEFL